MFLNFNYTNTGYTPSTAFILGNYAASGRFNASLDDVSSNVTGVLSNLEITPIYCDPYSKNFIENNYVPTTNIVIKKNNSYVPFANNTISMIGCSEPYPTITEPVGTVGNTLDTVTLSVSTSYYEYVPSLYTYFVPIRSMMYTVAPSYRTYIVIL